ncbi:hypothetical protein FRC10_006075, partial [Ceratobasidium sp. 414]
MLAYVHLAHPQPQKRPASDTDIGSSKHRRVDNEEDSDIDMANPVPDTPPLLSFMEQHPRSVSSTQRAVVNAFASQHKQARAPHTTDHARFGAGATPIPEPRDYFSRSAPCPASSERPVATPEPHPAPHEPHVLMPDYLWSPTPEPPRPEPMATCPVVTPEPRPAPRKPHILVPSSPLSPTPKPPRPKPTATLAPRVSPREPPPRHDPPLRHDPNTATESETEPEPELQPKPKKPVRSHHVGRSGGWSSRPAAKSSTHCHQRTPPRHMSGAASVMGHHDAKAMLKQLGGILNSSSSDNNSA